MVAHNRGPRLRGRPHKKTDNLSERALRTRTAWRNSVCRPPRSPDGWPQRWVWRHKRAIPGGAPEGYWVSTRAPGSAKNRLSQCLWKRKKALIGLKQWLHNRVKLELPVGPFTKKPQTPFRTVFFVGVKRATAALSRVRQPKAQHSLVFCPWNPDKYMHCAHYSLFHEVESLFDEQRALPRHTPGWLPARRPGEATTLLWSLDHARRTAPIGIWTVKELPSDCRLQNHHHAACVVVAAHIGSERKRELATWQDHPPFFGLIDQYKSHAGPLGSKGRNLVCCDAIAFQKLFNISPSNAYTNSPDKQCCLFCDRTHREVRQWNTQTSLEDTRATRLETKTPFSWQDCIPDYLLHGNRNMWYRLLKGCFEFLNTTGCAEQARQLLTGLHQVDPDLGIADPDVSWETAQKLLQFDFESVVLNETASIYTVHLGDKVINVDEAGLVVQLCAAWQDIYAYINTTGDPSCGVVSAVEQLCGLMRECISHMIPLGFNPTLWVHVICYHLPQHLYRFGNLRQYGLWGQEAKHRYFRRKYHTGPLVGAEALAYGMDCQRVQYKLDNGHLEELEAFLPPIPPTLLPLYESGEVELSDED